MAQPTRSQPGCPPPPASRRSRPTDIACHGEPETLLIGGDRVDLDEIAGELQERGVNLRGKTLYFGSCAVLATPQSRLSGFRAATRAQAVCGYRGEDGVEWLESAAFELMLFDYLATSGYKTAPPALRDLKREHAAAWKRLRFVADPDELAAAGSAVG